MSEYWDSLKNFRDWYSVISTAEKKGLEKGMEKGLEKGREEGREEGEKKKAMEVARYLKSSGASMELIIGASGLTQKEIEEL